MKERYTMRILIYGTGVMGKGIAQIMSMSNEVLLYNPRVESTRKAFVFLTNSIEKLVVKGKLSREDAQICLDNVRVIRSLEDAYEVDLVIEAVPEDIAIKKDKFKELDQIINKEAIFASNTSSLSITELAMVTNRPTQVIGMHFFNPAPLMGLVEVIIGMTTSSRTVEYVRNIAISLGKTPVLVNEAPGFIVNRMLIPMINEAIAIYGEGIASAEDIDTAMVRGANHPIGPLALADLIGLDVCLSIMDVLHKEFGIDKYNAHPYLRKMVRAHKLGRKTKEGFYKY